MIAFCINWAEEVKVATMIVVLDNSGRLCNRLVLFAHACATAIESRQSFCHLMAEDAMQFSKIDQKVKDKYKLFCMSRIPGWSFVLRCRQAFYERIRPPNVEKYKSGNALRAKSMAHRWPSPHIVLCWWYRDPGALVRQRDNICRILAPKEVFVRQPKMFIDSVRADGRHVVGVHVRRGDYREFEKGKYFFSDEEYARFMEMARRALHRECRFIMVSDEALDEGFFKKKGLDVNVFKGSDFREDLVMLSLCDYIMGPWSTFSWWAAFYGGRKLCHIHGRDDVIDEGSFRDITGNEV